MRPDTAEKQSILSFLPQPKHELLVLNHSNFYTEDAVEERKEEKNQRQDVQTDQQSSVEEASAAWQQYYQQQQQYQNSGAANLQEYYVAQGEDDVAGGSSKRRRTRERDIERALQDGHFETVAGQITDVHGVMPHAWQPPSNTLTGVNGSSDQQVKVKASFWNAQAGTMVSTVKPSRLQRQKHQLNQLAFDAKARDFELLEKRGTSLKTKRETYAKYGW
ncbi:unnamed protein product [Peronospora belbahrii]|nr:unnamed protein product [Peronospora belbahrii]